MFHTKVDLGLFCVFCCCCGRNFGHFKILASRSCTNLAVKSPLFVVGREVQLMLHGPNHLEPTYMF